MAQGCLCHCESRSLHNDFDHGRIEITGVLLAHGSASEASLRTHFQISTCHVLQAWSLRRPDSCCGYVIHFSQNCTIPNASLRGLLPYSKENTFLSTSSFTHFIIQILGNHVGEDKQARWLTRRSWRGRDGRAQTRWSQEHVAFTLSG